MNFLIHQIVIGSLPPGPHFVHCYVYEGEHCSCGGNYQGDQPGPDLNLPQHPEGDGIARPEGGPDVTALPEPTVQPTAYTVSLLPEDDVNYKFFALHVERRDRYGWTVHDGHSCLGADGTWDHGGISVYGANEAWVAAHRFDLDTALRLAKEAAPHVTVNGITAAEAYKRGQ